ncbi:hypothetical protein HYW17_04225 [Candidatus Uhrbacteria bacterium]|nr:hypothetical protein [Candidatus Uhrbacteria bacterium]
MAFIAPKFRRESWYGRLYLRAYGEDRGWLVRLKLAGSIGFDYAPCPEFPADVPEAERIGAAVDWRRRSDEAHQRSLAFLMMPPAVQPFVETGPKVSICPTFWKIVFAMLVYCPIVALRAMRRAIRDAARAALAAIASAFRWTGRRFGRPLAWMTAGAFVLASYGMGVYMIAAVSYGVTGYLMGRAGISPEEALLQVVEAQTRAEREQLRQDYLKECAASIRAEAERTVESYPECDTFVLIGGMSHEEQAKRCVGRDERYLSEIKAVEGGDHDCVVQEMYGWRGLVFARLFPGEAERKELATWLAAKLRERFAKEVQAGLDSRERRIAEARKEDAKVVGAAVAKLVPMQHDPRKLYEQFTANCRYEEYDKRWVARYGHGVVSNATCATLAGLFGPQIEDAQFTIRWQERRTALRQYGPGVGKGIGFVVGVVFLLALLVVLLDRYIRAIGRALAWFLDRIVWPVGKWTVIIATAPIWMPVRYLVWPALCLVGRSFRSVGLAFGLAFWNVWLVRTVRSAFVSVFTGIASGIRRFAAATRQVLADTWHLIRAFASAKWERLCPFIEWS